MENFDYVILGAGLGGLAAAACLTRQGNRVVVLESSDRSIFKLSRTGRSFQQPRTRLYRSRYRPRN